MNFLMLHYAYPTPGQAACAARMQPSNRPLLTLMVAPLFTGVKSKVALPEAPVVLVGLP